MRWYYLSQFTRYETALKQVKLHTMDKHDLLGSADDPSTRKSARGTAAYDPFSVGRRFDIIKNPSTQAITSYVAEENKTPQNMEVVFRTFNLALMDNASFEYTFLNTFLGVAQPATTIRRTFDAILAPTFKLGQELTRGLVDSSTDALGVLLCVRLTQRLAFDLQRRRVPPAEVYTNASAMLLWPRFQILVDLHADSLRRLAPPALAPPQAGAAPLPVSQRFASFLHGVLLLSSDAPDDEPLSNSLARLRADYEALVGRVAGAIPDARRRERFLYNNYSLVGTILEGTGGKLAEENREYFRRLREKHGEGYG
jgi:vacuolar protein sorting-associated protein 52